MDDSMDRLSCLHFSNNLKRDKWFQRFFGPFLKGGLKKGGQEFLNFGAKIFLDLAFLVVFFRLGAKNSDLWYSFTSVLPIQRFSRTQHQSPWPSIAIVVRIFLVVLSDALEHFNHLGFFPIIQNPAPSHQGYPLRVFWCPWIGPPPSRCVPVSWDLLAGNQLYDI